MRPERLLARIQSGLVSNVKFSDLCRLMESLGFELRRVSGSHHIFVHPNIPEIVNLQDVAGEAKPYQIRQVRRLVRIHDLGLDEG